MNLCTPVNINEGNYYATHKSSIIDLIGKLPIIGDSPCDVHMFFRRIFLETPFAIVSENAVKAFSRSLLIE